MTTGKRYPLPREVSFVYGYKPCSQESNFLTSADEKSAESIVPSSVRAGRLEFINKGKQLKMCKDKKHQKKETYVQMALFDRMGQPVGQADGGTISAAAIGDELSSQLKERRTLTENLLEQVVSYANLFRAYKQVKSNGGSGGVDGMSVEDLGKWLGKEIESLRERILEENYLVEAVRKVEIPKPSGGKRTLGIPTVKDRLIQQSIHQVLSIYYEPTFSDHSYGFRPGRSTHDAIRAAAGYVSSGKEWVVDLDLEKFFDTINHDRLMQRLSKGIGDKRLLRLIKAYLKAGMMEGGLISQRIAGAPQGGPLSPLLSNIVLDELDRELEKRGHSFCRYADDCNIYVSSRKAGERVMRSIVKFLEAKMKLRVNRTKSGVRHCSQVEFLGYTVLPNGGIRVSDKSILRFKGKVREITRRNRGISFTRIVTELNKIIVGWASYFRLANKWLATIRDLDGWIRRKLRCYRLKQCGRKFTIYKLLRSLGAAKGMTWNAIMYGGGWWSLSNKLAITQAMGIQWFSAQGLHSLVLRMKV